jgi:hypothetical protein
MHLGLNYVTCKKRIFQKSVRRKEGMDESITMKFVIKNSSQCMLTLILLMQRIG